MSIEKIVATGADDVVVVTTLDALRLAGNDATGGLYTIDLGGQIGGDLIDLSNAEEAMTVGLGGMSPRLYATATPGTKLYVTGAEQVLGSDFNDVLNGSHRGDVLAGGAGSDTISGLNGDDTLFSGASAFDFENFTSDVLLGGIGSDRLIAAPGSYAELTGGDGADQFFIPLQSLPGDTPPSDALVEVYPSARINDLALEDSIFWNGHKLSGGSAIVVDIEDLDPEEVVAIHLGYIDANGVVYTWFYDGDSTLFIDTPDGQYMQVEDWSQGKGGITLTGRQFSINDFDPDGLARSNIAHNGVLGDYENLTGAAAARATPGAVPEPRLPTPFATVTTTSFEPDKMAEISAHIDAIDYNADMPFRGDWRGGAMHVFTDIP